MEGENKGKTLREKVKGVALPMLVGLSMIGLASASKLPVYGDVRQKINYNVAANKENSFLGMLQEYNKSSGASIDYFNQSLEDSVIDRDEQKILYEKLSDTEEMRRKFNNYAFENKFVPENGYSVSTIWGKGSNIKRDYISDSESNLDLKVLVEKNYKGFDVGMPQLEKKLRREGCSATVERIMSDSEHGSGVLAFGLGSIALFISYLIFSKDESDKSKYAVRDIGPMIIGG